MKKLITMAAALMLSVSMFASEMTMFDGRSRMDHGGAGGFSVNVTKLGDADAVFVGGRGGWIIDHTITIGGGGYGLIPSDKFQYKKDGDTYKLMLGYGGLYLGYTANSDDLLHFDINTLAGAGNATFSKTSFDYNNHSENIFYVVEPGLNATLNVTKFFRVSAGATYKFVQGLDLTAPDGTKITSKDLEGPSANISFMFGKF